MKRRIVCFLSLAASVAVVACGGSNSSTSALPSAATSSNDGAGAGVVGTATTVTGTVTALTGSCPAVTFTLERKTIKTTAATSFGDGKCTDVKNDVKVTVAGTFQADGSVLATKVSVVAAPVVAPVPAITGAITERTGACPALTITVGAKTATTTSTTFFDGKGCGDLKAGIVVNIFGSVPPGGSTLVADKVASPK